MVKQQISGIIITGSLRNVSSHPISKILSSATDSNQNNGLKNAASNKLMRFL